METLNQEVNPIVEQVPAQANIQEPVPAPKEPEQKKPAPKTTQAKPAPKTTQAKPSRGKADAKKDTKATIKDTKADTQPKGNKTQKAGAGKETKAKTTVSPSAVPVTKFPKPLSGAAPIYLLFCAPRSQVVADNRRNESLNNMQNQLFLGVSVDKQLLENAKANYTKEHPSYYFWISTKKVLGEMPKDLGLALQLENVLVARGVM